MTSTTQTAAFQATYSDLRFVRTRKVVQVVLEAPIEHAAAITAALGYPDPAQETWVGVARLVEEPKKAVSSPHTPAATEKPAERRPFTTLSVGQQVGLRCKDPTFRAWVREIFFGLANHPVPFEEETVADWLRERFSVSSRRDIDPYEWAVLNRRFEAWKVRETA